MFLSLSEYEASLVKIAILERIKSLSRIYSSKWGLGVDDDIDQLRLVYDRLIKLIEKEGY